MNGSVSAAKLHPVVAEAAEGHLPSWAAAGDARRAHMRRVAALLDGWAAHLGLSDHDRRRWRSLGFLHDALREAPETRLRPLVPEGLHDLPGPVLHGPAAAERLAREGVDDTELLCAIRYHTLGHPKLGRAGLALYAADFLEPGRDLRNHWRASLRDRMPDDLEAVVREIVQARVLYLVGQGRPVRTETVALWNALSGGEPWAGASSA